MDKMPHEIIARIFSYLPQEEITYILCDFSWDNIEKEDGEAILLRWTFALEVQKKSSIYIDRHDVNIIRELDEWGEPMATYVVNAQERWDLEELLSKDVIRNCGLCVYKGDDYEKIIPFSCLGKLVEIACLVDSSIIKFDKESTIKDRLNSVVKAITDKFPEVRIDLN